MRYLLDSNACIHYLKFQYGNVRKRLQTISIQDVAVCSVVKAEMFYGAARSNNPAQTLARQQVFLGQFFSLPFDDQAAFIHGRLRADLYRVGTPIGPHDLMIVAIALGHNLTLITHNTREFNRASGLSLEDWEL